MRNKSLLIISMILIGIVVVFEALSGVSPYVEWHDAVFIIWSSVIITHIIVKKARGDADKQVANFFAALGASLIVCFMSTLLLITIEYFVVLQSAMIPDAARLSARQVYQEAMTDVGIYILIVPFAIAVLLTWGKKKQHSKVCV